MIWVHLSASPSGSLCNRLYYISVSVISRIRSHEVELIIVCELNFIWPLTKLKEKNAYDHILSLVCDLSSFYS